MNHGIDRRQFLSISAGGIVGAGIAGSPGLAASSAPSGASAPAAPRRFFKAVMFSMLPDSLPVLDRFRLAVDVGLEAVEVMTVTEDRLLDELQRATNETGLRVHSVMNSGNWDFPLTSKDPAIADKGAALVRRSLENAKALGADTVLLVPGIVTPDVRYKDAWTRSQAQIRRLLPLARELGVRLAIENVGNRFLLSPLEFARYVDEFNDPFLRAYFDIGNAVALWAYPQDWISTLAGRICKLHFKDYDIEKKRFVLPGEGAVDWPAVCTALGQIGYSGPVTAELKGGDQQYLRDIGQRMEKLLIGPLRDRS